MNIDNEIKKNSYFENRQVNPAFNSTYKLPKYLSENLPVNKEASMLDIGCGLGAYLKELKNRGYINSVGIDISLEAIEEAKISGLNVFHISSIKDFCLQSVKKYDLITMSHVLEHIEKNEIIEHLIFIKKYLLAEGGSFIVMVPNGQTNAGAYWMYEDFTHTTLFTSGSLYYVLKSAGFSTIEFLDPDGLEKFSGLKKMYTKILLWLYTQNYLFWNKITGTSTHKASPIIFTFEIKAKAS